MVNTTGSGLWRRWRGVLLWVAVLCVLVAYFWLVDLPRERATKTNEEQADRLLDFDPTAATTLSLKTTEGAMTLGKDSAGTWQILSPLKTTADQAAVKSLLNTLNVANRLRLIDENPAVLGSFGLEPAVVTLRISAGGVEHQIDFGDNGPVGSSAYVRVIPAPAAAGPSAAGAPASPVVLVPLMVKKAASKNLYDLRKKELFDFAASDVTAVELQYPNSSTPLIRLERRRSAAGTGAASGWTLTEPVRTAADPDAATALVKQISSLRATAILDGGKVEKKAELKRPKVGARMWRGDRSDALRLYFPLSEEVAYAVTSPNAPLFQVDRQSVLQLEKSVFDLQDKRVVPIDPESVQRFRIARPNGEVFQLTKGHDAWLVNGRPLSKEAVGELRKFFDELQRAKVEKVAGRTPSAWSKLGLRAGATVITLFSGGNPGIQPVVVRLGKQEGELLYIRRGDEAESYITSAPLLALINEIK